MSLQYFLEKCRTLKTNRDEGSILRSITAELGELSEEVDIHLGTSYKQPDVDGVVGEAIDVILSTIDLIAIHDQHITEDVIFEIMSRKVTKWFDKTKSSPLYLDKENARA